MSDSTMGRLTKSDIYKKMGIIHSLLLCLYGNTR